MVYEKLDKYKQESIRLFIINNHIDDEKSENSYKKRLFKELEKLPEKYIKNKKDIIKNIIYVNLKKNIIGIDKAFTRLYDYFKSHKIHLLVNKKK